MRTEIATIGEFGLIDRLTEGIEPKHKSTRYGIGDDAAEAYTSTQPSGSLAVGGSSSVSPVRIVP